jgi:hypothetical protein
LGPGGRSPVYYPRLIAVTWRRTLENDAEIKRRAEPMSTTVLPELAAESVGMAKRLVRLLAHEGLDPVEAEYIVASGLAAIQRVPKLWPIVRGRIGGGTTGPTAHEFLARLLDVVDKNLSLAGMLKEPARVVREELGREPEAASGLAAAEERLLQIRAEAVQLLKVVDAPAQWPREEQLREAKERMRGGDRLTAEECRQALLDE